MKGSRFARAEPSDASANRSRSLCAAPLKVKGLFLMTTRTASGTARVLRVLFGIPVAVALAFVVVQQAVAQQSSTNPPATTPAPGQNAKQQLQLVASPWTRYCAKGPAARESEITTKDVCFTASDGHLASGEKVVIALLIDSEEGGGKLLRVTLPLGVALVPGARIVIDEKEAMTAPFEVCLAKSGCMADYKADDAMIAKLKKGKTLAIQAFDKSRPISFTLPLLDFAKAYDGPPSDPTGLDAQQENLMKQP